MLASYPDLVLKYGHPVENTPQARLRQGYEEGVSAAKGEVITPEETVNSLTDDRSSIEQPQVEMAAESVELDEGAPDEGRMSGGEADTPPVLKSQGSSKAVNLSRNITKASEVEGNLFAKLKNEGTISSAGRSGSERPLSGTPNSYVKTEAGHKLVYDSEGRLIYDISSERMKMTVWDKAPNGKMYPRDVKLKGEVPEEFLK